MRLIPCTDYEATHVQVLSIESYPHNDLTANAIYPLLRETRGGEEYESIVSESGLILEDFILYTSVLYLKEAEDNMVKEMEIVDFLPRTIEKLKEEGRW